MSPRKINISLNVILTIRIIIFALIFVLFVFELSSFLEYKFYLSQILRFVLFFIIILSSVLLLSFLLIIFINPEKFYFNLRNTFQNINATTLHDLYSYLIMLQLKKVFKITRNNTFKYYSTTDNYLNINSVFTRIDYFSFVLLFILLFNLFLNRNIFFNGAIRLFYFHETFYKPDLLQYRIYPDKLEVLEGDNFEIKALINGQYIPEFVTIKYDGVPYKIKIHNKTFSFVFKNVRKDFVFNIENKSLNHSKSFFVKCISKVFFTDYYCIINYPLYLVRLPDTVFDISYINIPEGSNISYFLKWHGDASLFINGASYSSHNNYSFSQKISDQNSTYFFRLIFNDIIKDSIVSHVNSIPDSPPAISLQHDFVRKELFLSFSDDIGLDIGKITFVLDKNNKIFKYGSKNLIFKGDKSADLKLFIDDSIPDYDTLKIEVLAKDNCSLRYQSTKKTFILSTPEIQSQSMLNSLMNNLNTQQLQIKSINTLTDNIEQLIKYDNDNTKSNYFNITTIQGLKNNIENLESLLNTDFNKDSKELINLIDSLFSATLNLDPNKSSNFDQNQLKKLSQLKELAKMIEQTLSKEYEETNSQIIDLLRKEIKNQISEYQKLMLALNDSVANSNLRSSLEKLNSKHESIEQLSNKISDKTFNDLKNMVQDSLNSIKSLAKDLPNPSSQNKLSNKLSKINRSYSNVDKMLEDFQNSQSDKKYFDYQQIISLLKKGNLLSQKVENSLLALSYYSIDRTIQNNLSSDFSYFEKSWQTYRDSLTRFVTENELPISFFMENIYKIEQARDIYLKSFKALNRIDGSRNAGIIMESLNKINNAISELLEATEDDNNMQMDGQQCMKPRKGGKKGKPKPSSNMQEMLEQLSDMQQQMKSQVQKGKQNSINGKELLELVNQQQMIREALSQLMNNAENKNISSLLQEAIEEMKKNEKQLLDKRNIDNNMLTRLEQIKTRLLDAEKARQEQEFENKRESKDFGHYLREWDHYNQNSEGTSQTGINELLKPNPISLRKYYFEKEKIYQQIK